MFKPTSRFQRTWCPSDNSGHPQIDAEHRALVDSMAEIGAAIAAKRDATFVFELLAAAVRKCVAHFINEEAILGQIGFPEANSHTQIHVELADKMRRLLEEHSSGGLATMEMVAALLYHPLVLHMVTEDQKYYQHLRLHMAAA